MGKAKDWQKIEITEEFQKIFDLLNNSRENIFVTGRAGTGKSTLLEYFRSHTVKNLVVLAPTGVAAVNVRGQTIHSFFGFHPNITPEKVNKMRNYKTGGSIFTKIETMVIDEISMVRADLLDCVDRFMRLNGNNPNLPFGGVQMIFFGDLYQLPPVVTNDERKMFDERYASPYFFSAKVFEQKDLFEPKFNLKIFELEKIYRQKNNEFVKILNRVRTNEINDSDLQILNANFNPDFSPSHSEMFVYLTSTNALADNVNQSRLRRLAGEEFYFEGQVSGRFGERNLPTDLFLKIKIGAQVMMLKNDPEGRWFNGSVGRVLDVVSEKNENGDWLEQIVVELSTGELVTVGQDKWEMYEFKYDRQKGWIESRSVGSFIQYPLKLAWAMTIHKSQGQTFEKLIIDIGSGTFAHGQLYVALSRAVDLSGLILKRKIEKRHIIVDEKVKKFFKS